MEECCTNGAGLRIMYWVLCPSIPPKLDPPNRHTNYYHTQMSPM